MTFNVKKWQYKYLTFVFQQIYFEDVNFSRKHSCALHDINWDVHYSSARLRVLACTPRCRFVKSIFMHSLICQLVISTFVYMHRDVNRVLALFSNTTSSVFMCTPSLSGQIVPLRKQDPIHKNDSSISKWYYLPILPVAAESFFAAGASESERYHTHDVVCGKAIYKQ